MPRRKSTTVEGLEATSERAPSSLPSLPVATPSRVPRLARSNALEKMAAIVDRMEQDVEDTVYGDVGDEGTDYLQGEDVEEEERVVVKRGRNAATRTPRGKKKKVAEVDALAIQSKMNIDDEAKGRKAEATLAATNGVDSDSDLTPIEEDSPPMPLGGDESTKKKRKRQPKASPELDEDGNPVKKKRATRKPKPEPVYVIPEVKTLETQFRGRLGYACLNTILRKQKPPVFCSRTCRIDTIKKNGMEYLKDLGKQNMKDLAALIEWNEAHHIKFMRMSSEMFPFASHPEYGYSLEYAQEELKAAGDLAKKYGHRLTTHPGQFTQLGSPRKEVVKNAFRDLNYHCEMMDRMGLDKNSIMIIHGGGVFGDKPTTLERMKENYKELPQNVKDRLVLENDEICYNVDDLMPICEELNIPLVFDYHHDWIYPSSSPPSELIPRINALWERKGIKPKQHLSEPRRGAVTVMERRAHADRCQTLPPDLPVDMDLMIEAKDKEQAVFELHRIYQLKPTIHSSLRPPAEEETLHTNGRKSNKRKKKDTDEGAEEMEEGLEDPEATSLLAEQSGLGVEQIESGGSEHTAGDGLELVPPPETPAVTKQAGKGNKRKPSTTPAKKGTGRGKGMRRKASVTKSVLSKPPEAEFVEKMDEDDMGTTATGSPDSATPIKASAKRGRRTAGVSG